MNVRSFINELGNLIKITIEGPSSTSENTLTLMEGERLRDMLVAELGCPEIIKNRLAVYSRLHCEAEARADIAEIRLAGAGDSERLKNEKAELRRICNARIEELEVRVAQLQTRLHVAIELTPAERQSGHDRVRQAEGLIRQLPDDHDGRNGWLLNFGRQP